MSDVLASFRAEWLKLSKRPATWVLGVIQAALLLSLAYGFVFLLVVVLGREPSGTRGVQAALRTLKPELYPAHFLQSTLGAFSGIGYGSAIAVIAGVLAYGSEYGWSTLKTVFTQHPGRLATVAGKLLAIAISLAVYSLVVLAAAAAAAAVFGAAYGSFSHWPGILDVLKAFGAIWLIMGLWAALGVFFAVLFKQAALAIGLGIVYSVAVEGLIVNTLSLVSSLTDVRRAFPGANASALVNAFGARAAHALVGPTQAILVVTAYLVVFLLISAAVLRQRDVT